jgi:hypothetical protein
MNKECIKKLEEAIEALSKYNEQQDNRIKVPKQPEPQKERKVVFDFWTSGDGRKKSQIHKPTEFDEVIEIYKIGENSFLFAAKDKTWDYPYIYIGHYE